MEKNYDRRDFLKQAGLGSALLTMPGMVQNSEASNDSSKKKTNVILIMADDVGYECFGCYGSKQYKTPHIDRLAETGVRFTHCYSNPLCTPSRVKIMTGQSNIRNYYTFGILLPGQKTFGHMMQNAGYKTAVVGKWQLYGPDIYGDLEGKGTLPNDAGFDEYCLWQVKRRESRYWDPLIDCNGEYLTNTEGKYGPDIFCDYAIDFIARNKEKLFFLYFPMTLPHGPFLPTPDSEDRDSKDNQKNYEDMVAYVDTIVGRLVSALHEHGLRDDTLILFTGDNGTPRQIKSRLNGRVIQGGKSKTTNDGTRVPFIANWPRVTPVGKVCDDLVDFSDFLPSIAAAAGASLPENVTLDGQSFLPQLQGKKGTPREAAFTYYNPRPQRKNDPAHKNPTHRYARDKRWKFYGDGDLYDIENDVLEENPIAPGEGGKEAAQARKKLRAVINSFPDEPQLLMET